MPRAGKFRFAITAHPVTNLGGSNMTQLFYITATPKSPDHSVGLQVGRAFLQVYREAHPDDDVRVFDVYQEGFQTVDGDVVRAWEKLRKERWTSPS
jgi:FMN-dependent NADH-azoreductase